MVNIPYVWIIYLHGLDTKMNDESIEPSKRVGYALEWGRVMDILERINNAHIYAPFYKTNTHYEVLF